MGLRSSVDRSALVVMAGLALAPAVASAQPITEEGLIARGISLREAGNDAQALAVFQQAWELHRGPRARAQLALAEQALARWVDADAHLRDALAAQTHPWIRRNRAALEGALAVVQQHLGSVEVRGAPEGATLRVEGREITLPTAQPVRVLAGSVALEVRAPGYLPWSRTVTVEAGATVQQDVTLLRDAPAPAAVEAPPQTVTVVRETRVGSPVPRTLGIAALGLGGAALVTGTVAWALQVSAAHRWNSDAVCLDGGRSREENCGAERESAERWRALAVAGTVTGVLVGALGVVLLVTAPPSRTVVTERRAGWTCGGGPGALGMSCGAAF